MTAAVCAALGVSPATVEPPIAAANAAPAGRPRPTSPRARTDAQRQAIQDLLHEARFADLTSDQVDDGPIEAVHAARQVALDQAFSDYTVRFIIRPSDLPGKPTATWINPPKRVA
jgi:hypothetical protein